MSNDIAVLGIKVDSSSAVTAATNLKALTAAATPAAVAATNLEKASRGVATAHAGMSTQAMAAFHSTRSLVEMLAMGMPVTQALTAQMNHLSYAATGSNGLSGAFKEVAGSLLRMISPTTLVVGGLAAIGAAGAFAISSIAKTEIAFDNTARAIGTTIAALHGLDAACAAKGIDTDELLKGMEKFGASVYDAKNGMGELAATFRANGASAKTFDDYLEKAADLIKGAGSNQQRLAMLQQMGLPATMQWVDLLSGGAKGLRDAAAEATKFGETADYALIAKAKKFDEEWSKTWKNFKIGAQSAILDTATWLETLNGKLNVGLMKLGVDVPTNLLRDAMTGGPTPKTQLTSGMAAGFYDATGLGKAAADPSKDLAAMRNRISIEQPLIGLLGQTPAVAKPQEKEENDSDHSRRAA